MTIQRREEEIKKTAREQQEAGCGSSSSSSTTTYHTGPGVSAHDLDVIRQYYNSFLGSLNQVKASVIEQAIRAGVETSAILDALEQTGIAPRPSHYYFAAILRRYMREGITTQEKAEAQRFQRRHEREMARMDREHAWYDNPNELSWWIGGDEA